MGQMIAKLDNLLHLWSSSKNSILMLGLDAAGKTTILYKLKLNETLTTMPTIGFNVEEVRHKNLIFTVWDLGGQDRIRPLWRHYFTNVNGVIFVVDSGDRERLAEAKHELSQVLRDDLMKRVPLLVLANKQDLPKAMSVSEIENGLSLKSLTNREWHLQSSNALNGEGLFEGLDELSVMCRKGRRTPKRRRK